MDDMNKNEVKWTPTDTGALLDVDSLTQHYATKGGRGRGREVGWGREGEGAAGGEAHRAMRPAAAAAGARGPTAAAACAPPPANLGSASPPPPPPARAAPSTQPQPTPKRIPPQA